MSELKIRIKGLKKLQAGLRKSPARINKALQTIIKKSALLIERESKKKTPVDTGRLRASIFTSIFSRRAIVQPKTNYAIYVHEGTRYMRARPFMEHGLKNARAEINRIVNKEINLALSKI